MCHALHPQLPLGSVADDQAWARPPKPPTFREFLSQHKTEVSRRKRKSGRPQAKAAPRAYRWGHPFPLHVHQRGCVALPLAILWLVCGRVCLSVLSWPCLPRALVSLWVRNLVLGVLGPGSPLCPHLSSPPLPSESSSATWPSSICLSLTDTPTISSSWVLQRASSPHPAECCSSVSGGALGVGSPSSFHLGFTPFLCSLQ